MVSRVRAEKILKNLLKVGACFVQVSFILVATVIFYGWKTYNVRFWKEEGKSLPQTSILLCYLIFDFEAESLTKHVFCLKLLIFQPCILFEVLAVKSCKCREVCDSLAQSPNMYNFFLELFFLFTVDEPYHCLCFVKVSKLLIENLVIYVPLKFGCAVLAQCQQHHNLGFQREIIYWRSYLKLISFTHVNLQLLYYKTIQKSASESLFSLRYSLLKTIRYSCIMH